MDPVLTLSELKSQSGCPCLTPPSLAPPPLAWPARHAMLSASCSTDNLGLRAHVEPYAQPNRLPAPLAPAAPAQYESNRMGRRRMLCGCHRQWAPLLTVLSSLSPTSHPADKLPHRPERWALLLPPWPPLLQTGRGIHCPPPVCCNVAVTMLQRAVT